jgi:predicted Zn-dependent protease with MMP-like domain
MPFKRRGELARQHPERRVELPEDQHTSFEALVERALDELPDEFGRLLGDVAIVIEDVPSREQIRLSGGPADGWLYGLYEGVPATEWGADMVPLPNKITLFQVPLETDFADPDELAKEVRITVIHELAHHAGIDDERLHELDLD